MALPPPTGRVRRRHVLYLSGFDPQGPGHYHKLYVEQAALQARVLGVQIDVGPRQREGSNSAWDVRWRGAAGEAVDTRYEFLRWDDIVRAHWPRGQLRLLGLTLGTTWRLLANGSLWRMLQTSWPAFLALAAPAGLIVSMALAVVGVLALGWWVGVTEAAPLWALPICSGLLTLLFLFARHAQAKVQMAWLMRSAAVILKQSRGELAALEQRLDAFAARLVAIAGEPEIDEVLVVGHSSGAMLAVSVMARALAAKPALLAGPRAVSLLTLGQCIPVLSYQPAAEAFRAELAALRRAEGLAWIDMTAPPDGCCFALMDPTEVCLDGLPIEARGAGGPKRLSPRFAQSFSLDMYRRIKRDKHRCHFQYLMATELPAAYDYFSVSAGPLRLSERFAQTAGVTRFTDFQCFGGPAR